MVGSKAVSCHLPWCTINPAQIRLIEPDISGSALAGVRVMPPSHRLMRGALERSVQKSFIIVATSR